MVLSKISAEYGKFRLVQNSVNNIKLDFNYFTLEKKILKHVLNRKTKNKEIEFLKRIIMIVYIMYYSIYLFMLIYYLV